MEQFLTNFLLTYSLPTIVISLAIYVIIALFDKFCKAHWYKVISGFLPFILGIVFSYFYEVICSKAFTFNVDIVYTGVLCGTLATIISAFFNKVKKEGISTDAVILLIEGIIDDYIKAELLSSTAKSVKEIIETQSSKTITSSIKDILSKNALDGFSDETLNMVATLIVKTVNSKKN